MDDSKKEMEFLESVTHTYVMSDSPQDRLIKTLAVRTFQPYMQQGKRALEFGCSDGFMTGFIAGLVDQLRKSCKTSPLVCPGAKPANRGTAVKVCMMMTRCHFLE